MPEGTGGASYGLGGAKTRAFDKAGGLSHAKMDLSLTVSGGTVLAEYMCELFDAMTMERLLSSFVNVLEQVVDDSSSAALRCSLLGPRDALEAARLSMGVERPEYLSAPLVHDAFEGIAAASPQSRCLCYEGEWLTYGEVAQRVSLGAAHLASLGVGPGVVVGVMLDRSFELVISILAVLKAGGCYLPCDPSYPDDRLSVYLEDGNAFLVLASVKHAERAKAMVGDGVPVLDITAETAVTPVRATLRQPGPDDPAYIIFTSGSTGRPKGVMIPHRGVRDLIPWLVDRHKIGAY
jgi:non-ribosomal peptide synthetase component F